MGLVNQYIIDVFVYFDKNDIHFLILFNLFFVKLNLKIGNIFQRANSEL